MRIVRITAVVVGTLVALVVVVIIALLLFVDPNRYRGDIEKAVREHSSRELTLHGKLELKVFPWLALSVHDAELSNRPGFGQQPFLTVQNASIGVKLLPLLSKRLEVSRVKLEGAHVNLVNRAEQNNWQDLGDDKSAAEKPANESSGSPPPISIEGVDVSKASVTYSDEVKRSITELDNLELHTGRLDSNPARTALEKVELQGTYLSQPSGTAAAVMSDANAVAAARASAGRAPGTAVEVASTAAGALANATAAGGPSSAASHGEVKPLVFSLTAAAITMDNTAHTLAPTKIQMKVGEVAVDISLAGEKMSGERIVAGSLSVPSTSARKLLQSLGIAPPVTRDPKALAAFALQTNFRLTQKDLQLSALQLTLDDTRIQGTAGVEDLDTSAVRFNLNVNGINIDRYRAPVSVEKPTAVKRPASPLPAVPPTPLPLETLRKLDVNGMLHVASATFSNVVFTDVVMPLVAKDGRVRLGPTQAHLYGGSYNGDIVLDARPVQAQLSLDQHLRGIDIGALMKAAVDSARLSGSADANVAMTGVGNTDDAIKRSLNGKIDVNVKQGAVVGVDVVYELQRVNALFKRQVPAQRPAGGPARTNFNALQMNGGLDKGVLRIDALTMETDFLKVHGRGTLDTITEAINYQVVAAVNKLPAGKAPAGGGGLDALGALEVPLTITGTMSSPTVRPDIEALAKGKLGQEVQQKAGDLVKKKLGDTLKNLLGR